MTTTLPSETAIRAMIEGRSTLEDRVSDVFGITCRGWGLEPSDGSQWEILGAEVAYTRIETFRGTRETDEHSFPLAWLWTPDDEIRAANAVQKAAKAEADRVKLEARRAAEVAHLETRLQALKGGT